MTVSRKPDIILYGGPAAGKSTQAAILIKKLSAAHMYMGGELRAIAREDTALGRSVKKIVDAGLLVGDKIAGSITQRFIEQTPQSKRIIFDGYPRSIAQARLFMRIMKQYNREVVMVDIKLPITVALARLSTRAGHGNRIDDIDPKAIRTRLNIFRDNSRPLQTLFRELKAYIPIDGKKTVAQVTKDIITAVQ